MMENITEVSEWTATLQKIQDALDHLEAATLTPPLQGLANRTKYIKSKLFNHRHDGASDGGALDYAVDSGTASVCAVTYPVTLAAHVTGMPLNFKAKYTNTGGTTINVNGLGAVAITLASGDVLKFGNIRKDGIYTIIYGGSGYVLLNPSTPVGQCKSGYVLDSGFLVRNGATKNRADYPDLWAWVTANSLTVAEASKSTYRGLFGVGNGTTTFTLPDTQGTYERSFDATGTIDAGAELGKYEDDMFKAHYHASSARSIAGEETLSSGGTPAAITGDRTGITGGAETRPKSIPMLMMISY